MGSLTFEPPAEAGSSAGSEEMKDLAIPNPEWVHWDCALKTVCSTQHCSPCLDMGTRISLVS